jgi:alpha-amylase/alpha-mannosidase (GH57 family)
MGYICIHGHFYQPPRENPWLETVEIQESAHPHHDWNERITAECYAPNAASRILDEKKRIVKIVNNYAKISFNFGPTLLSWMETNDPEVYRAILAGDEESARTFGGHGSALAQPYNHMIMPLANDRDRRTQVIWGIRDFTHRFGRTPEGMWLPETAVDLKSLEVMAEHGIKFTILAPDQAKRVRKIGGRNWKDVSGERIDPTMAYRQNLPAHRSMDILFYDGPISRAVAFEGLLANGEHFAQRLLGAFSEETRPWPELVHIATDGETYGHHHRYGEMGLTYALNHIESNGLAEITNYGQYIERHPPTHTVEIRENTSWSCIHGVERWRSNCGCNSGGHPQWNQTWRTPLREALDWLRDCLAPQFEEDLGKLLKDPWAARDDYISVILDRSPENVKAFMEKHVGRELSQDEQVRALKLLELQRHAMLMYTSCGWFFDELSGIETVQVLQYAGRAIHLAQELSFKPIEPQFLELLAKAKSNLPEHRDGRHVYELFVKPAFVDLQDVGVHYAIRSLFEPYAEKSRVYCYEVERDAGLSLAEGSRKLAVGRARFRSCVTQESGELVVVSLSSDDQSPKAWVRQFRGEDPYQVLVAKASEEFRRGDMNEVNAVLQGEFDGEGSSLGHLFKDEQRGILQQIVEAELAGVEPVFDRICQQHIRLMGSLTRMRVPLPIPKAFFAVAEFVINRRLRRVLAGEELDPAIVSSLLKDAELSHIALEVPTLEHALRRNIERLAARFLAQPADRAQLEALSRAVAFSRSLPFEVNLWRIQNICYHLHSTVYSDFKSKAQTGDAEAAAWIESFSELGQQILLRIE